MHGRARESERKRLEAPATQHMNSTCRGYWAIYTHRAGGLGRKARAAAAAKAKVAKVAKNMSAKVCALLADVDIGGTRSWPVSCSCADSITRFSGWCREKADILKAKLEARNGTLSGTAGGRRRPR
jgi:hypothetical protein